MEMSQSASKKILIPKYSKQTGGGGNCFLNSDKKLYLYAEGISWMFSVIVGHVEGFVFVKIIFPAKQSIFAFACHTSESYVLQV